MRRQGRTTRHNDEHTTQAGRGADVATPIGQTSPTNVATAPGTSQAAIEPAATNNAMSASARSSSLVIGATDAASGQITDELSNALACDEALDQASPAPVEVTDEVSTIQEPVAPLSEPCTLIRDLKPNISPGWVLHARVLARGPVRPWDNFRDKGHLQEIFLLDSNGDVMRTTLFDDAVTRFADVTTPGSVCTLSGGKIKLSFGGANASTRESQLSFGADGSIKAISTDRVPHTEPSFQLTRIADLATLNAGVVVNVIGILLQSSETKRLMSAKGKMLTKRELVIIDDSNMKVFCTLWGNYASYDLPDAESTPLLIQAGKVSDYKTTRSVDMGIGSAFMISPSFPRADELTKWYAAGVDHASFDTLKSP